MYNINFDRHFNLVNWSCIYWGIQKRLIEPKNAVIYANKLIEELPDADSSEIIELLIIDKPEKENVLPLIEKLFSDEKELEIGEQSAIRRLRFILLFELQKNITNNQNLLDKIEDIYADFDYPADMEGFISYMPVKDGEYDAEKHSYKENEQRLMDKFNIFMKEEYSKLF